MNPEAIKHQGAVLKTLKQQQKQAEIKESAGEFGVKHEDIDDSFLQAKQLEFVHRKLAKQIAADKVMKLGTLCTGEYDKDRNEVRVTKFKGKAWSHYGHAFFGSLWLYPEEAIFLMDIFALRVCYGGVILSMQEAYSLFLNKEITLHHVLVFNYLSRLGYILMRYDPEGSEADERSHEPLKTENKRKIDLFSEQSLQVSSKRRQRESEVMDTQSTSHISEGTSGPYELPVACSDNCCMSYQPGRLFNYSSIKLFSDNHVTESSERNVVVIPEDNPEVEGTRSLFSCHSLINFKHNSDKSKLDNWCEQKQDYMKTPITFGDPNSSDSERKHIASSNFSTYSLMGYKSTLAQAKSQSWSQFKKQHEARLRAKPEVLSNESSLVLKSDLTNIPTLMSKLSLSKTVTLADLKSKICKVKEDSVIFNVYNPNSKFKRKEPGTPVFRVRITSSFDKIPSMPTICHTSTDEIPLYWAVCDGADISFYSFIQETIIPNLRSYNEKPKPRKKNGNPLAETGDPTVS